METADDILEAIGIAAPRAAASRAEALDAAAGEVSDPVLRHMDAGEIYAVDDLIERSGLDSATLLLRLTELEIAGRVAPRRRRAIRPLASGMLT